MWQTLQGFCGLGPLPAGSTVALATPSVLRQLCGKEATPAVLQQWEVGTLAGGDTAIVLPDNGAGAATPITESQQQKGDRDELGDSAGSLNDDSNISSAGSSTTGSQQAGAKMAIETATNATGAASEQTLPETLTSCFVCGEPPGVTIPLWQCPQCSHEVHIRCLAAAAVSTDSPLTTKSMIPQWAVCPNSACSVCTPWGVAAAAVRAQIQAGKAGI
jgi:hypothetical protein